jgi:hypothetical protein
MIASSGTAVEVGRGGTVMVGATVGLEVGVGAEHPLNKSGMSDMENSNFLMRIPFEVSH